MRKSVKYLLIIITIVLFLILVVGVGLLLDSYKLRNERIVIEESTGLRASEPSATNLIPYCGDELIFFTLSPISLKDVLAITPLGSVDPPASVYPSDALEYQIIGNSQGNNSRRIPVVSAGEGWITSVYFEVIDGKRYYSLQIQPCQEITLTYEGLVSLNEQLTREVSDVSECNENSSLCKKAIQVPTKTGEALGTVEDQVKKTDFYLKMYDRRISDIPLLNPFRFGYETTGVPTCPLYYFSPQSRNRIQQKLGIFTGGVFNQRFSYPVCGEVFQETRGTIEGIWILRGASSKVDTAMHLALIHDPVDISKPIFSIGGSLKNIPSGEYTFTPKQEGIENIDFNATVQGEVYCYELIDVDNRAFVILAQLIDESNLRIESFRKSHCDKSLLFTSQAVTYTK